MACIGIGIVIGFGKEALVHAPIDGFAAVCGCRCVRSCGGGYRDNGAGDRRCSRLMCGLFGWEELEQRTYCIEHYCSDGS
jgi:hypothetical protein